MFSVVSSDALLRFAVAANRESLSGIPWHMESAPKSLRLTIALFGRTNSGKSSLLNRIAGQSVAITSPEPGTTTDCVEKAMELLPIGPILLIDTAGLDDPTRLGAARVAAARKVFDRADVVLLVVAAGQWGQEEESVVLTARERKIQAIPVITFSDRVRPDESFLSLLRKKTGHTPVLASANRDQLLNELRAGLLEAAPDDCLSPPPLLADLVNSEDTVMLIVPIDKQAPKGRLILPQMQTIRDALDMGALPFVCRETEYRAALKKLQGPPALVICDSQVVKLMVRDTPPGIPCTTFSILFARFKGDIHAYAEGTRSIRRLQSGDRVLIAEGCTHHATDVDIGRVKIPKLLGDRIGGCLRVTVCSGRDYPEDVSDYKLIVHCGGCMLNRRETLRRIELAREANVPITNYGMTIAECLGVFERVMSPFSPNSGAGDRR